MKKIITLVILLSYVALMQSHIYLFIGDSITDGNWGSPKGYPCSSDQRNKSDKNHILGHGYVEMIAGRLMGDYPERNYEFYNRGISGETMNQIAERWDKDVVSNNPDVISLLCGTNDVQYWLDQKPETIDEFDFSGFIQTLDSLINYTRIKLPESEIFICTPFVAKVGKISQSTDYSLREQAVDSLSVLIKDYIASSEYKAIYPVDFNKLLKKLGEEKGDMEYWIWDGIHPTTAMHHRMMKEWLTTWELSNK